MAAASQKDPAREIRIGRRAPWHPPTQFMFVCQIPIWGVYSLRETPQKVPGCAGVPRVPGYTEGPWVYRGPPLGLEAGLRSPPATARLVLNANQYDVMRLSIVPC